MVERVGCAACHAIPGIDWPEGRSGPSLEGFGASPLIAGRLPNQPDVLTAWLIDPPSLAPNPSSDGPERPRGQSIPGMA